VGVFEIVPRTVECSETPVWVAGRVKMGVGTRELKTGGEDRVFGVLAEMVPTISS
jgi:hypothetical protein